MLRKFKGVALAGAALAGVAAVAAPPTDLAEAFGQRPSASHVRLSPSGGKVAYIIPATGQGTALVTVDLAGDRIARVALSSSGRPERLTGCDWVTDARLVCRIYAITNVDGTKASISRMIAVNAEGGDVKMLSLRQNERSLGVAFGGGEVLDYLPGGDGSVLMGRIYVPENETGTHIVNRRRGYGVDRIDTLTLRSNAVESPRDNAIEYLSDGRGTVRMMGMNKPSTYRGYATPLIDYLYRAKGSRDWKPFGTWNFDAQEGFNPYAVDDSCNCVYGFAKQDGRMALMRVRLDDSKAQEPLVTRGDVDVDDLIRLGRAQRVIGASYATERREAVYFDAELEGIAAKLSKALPGLPLINFEDASLDESRLLIWAGSDTDPGRYFIYDKKSRKLDEVILTRPELEGIAPAPVKPVGFKAADGTTIPAYLTLPPGKADAKGLPAIVMPHGGPSARDEWGFDWLAQYYAHRGFAVLQPNFRGSSGYGDAWFRDKGFKSWRIAIGDVLDGGRWLVASGLADPAKLAIVGWSYGGYAALQAAVTDPALFKAVVAIAPVTDLAALKESRREYSDFNLVSSFVGSGPHVVQGSPAQQAAALRAPVLLVHGDQDLNVPISQSRLMEGKLRGAGKPGELIVFPGLDHQLDDSVARKTLLGRSDAFLRKALAM
ncbi:alpha/beta hydrolase family protein [Sphingomonas jatrophae]|uniref:Dipeptidyl aminopeptidase/acylaminoacyl peptidase n=1 Tax=Sphingomonas jatrophae TaxID=1166337 RepID=A0A1I6L4F5_9SPHN|nr:S9 family peptidase [Sphingomonas jatrophae]SFR98324.1 Dipeptidyl aminopeptidase/acylaminoacyl peptidase [Sphingomonas jatrophae]